MEYLTQFIQQAELLARQHVPPDVLSKGTPIAIGVLLLGIGVAVLGAKLARSGVTLLFVVSGLWLGARFAGQAEVPGLVAMSVGAATIGVIGFLTYRLWVGAAMALVLAVVSLGVFGYQRVMPHVTSFAETQLHTPPVEFSLPSPEQRLENQKDVAGKWVADFWSYVQSKDGRAASNSRSIAATAVITGLLLGLLCTRLAAIVAAGFLGTGMAALSLSCLCARISPSLHDGLLARPWFSGAVLGGMLVSSLVLQTIMTRKPGAKTTPEPKGR